jgi:predicted phosphodiesterase
LLGRVAHMGVVIVLAVAAAIMLVGLTARAERSVGPGTVSLTARWGLDSRTEVLLPPFGTISADTHAAPLTIRASVQQIDVEAVQDLVIGHRPRRDLQQQAEDDLGELLRSFAVRAGLTALVTGAVVGGLVPGRSWASVAVGAAAGVAAVGLLLFVTWTGYEPRAFEEARFQGPIERAPQLIETATQYVEDFQAVRERIEVLGAQLAELYATSTTEALAGGPGDTTILHVSDMHLNPVGLELTRDLAEQFSVDAIIDTGDLTTFGSPLEAEFGGLVADMPAPYFFVPGNHDSFSNRRALEQSENLQVLDATTASVAGVEVLGMADPVFTANNDVTPDEVDAALADQAIDTRNLVRQHEPDILAVHDPRQAQVALGEVPLVIAGHVHETTFEEQDGTIVLTVGSTGATGLGSFTVDADLAYEAEVLHLDDGRLVALDTIALRGTDGEFRIERRLLDPERDETDVDSRSSTSRFAR